VKVMTLVGTRPEIIRLSRVIASLDANPDVDHVLVHTGQNWDYRLNEIFFEELDLRPPDHVLSVKVSSLGATLGDIITKAEAVLSSEEPDAFLVLGDTNSALAVIMAKRMQVATYHMEAGNRSFDANVPEEINRRLVDHVADFNLAYTEHARRNLLAEGLHPRRVLVSGSPMREVLEHYAAKVDASNVLEELEVSPSGYFLASAHREENVDHPERLAQLVESLHAVGRQWNAPVLVSTHPRTRARLDALGLTVDEDAVRFLPPFGFLDYVRLQKSALCVLSDSGTISEESALLGFPAVTLRAAIERPEALDTGSITMTDVNPRTVLAGVRFALSRTTAPAVPADYAVANTSERVVNFMLSTVPQHRFWSGLR
jgi:UDP-N-acetyl-L-fucosamine synthase